jgi:hypothetical protein
MQPILSSVIDFMEEGHWHYDIIEGHDLLRFFYKGKSGRILCYADVDENDRWLVFYSYLPVNTPAAKIHDMAEFVARANRGMRIGNFELDFEDGEVRFKTSIDVEGGELTSKMIDNLLQANLVTMDRYFSGMMELIYGDKMPKELVQKMEGNWDADDSLSAADDEDEDEELGGAEFRVDDDDEDEGNRRQAG